MITKFTKYRIGCLFAIIFLFFISDVINAQKDDIKKLPKGLLLPAKEYNRSGKIKAQILTAIFEENFENGGSSWTKSGSWEVGAPVSGPGSGHLSTNCAATNLDGNYSNYADDWLISPPIFLPTLTNSFGEYKLYFWNWFALESGYDYGYIKISSDNGNSWTTLHTINGSSNWTESVIDVTVYEGQTIKIAFNLTSDVSVTYEGWYIDDLRIESEEPQFLTTTITNLNSQNFPFIYMNVAVDTNGTGIGTLNQTNFLVTENSVVQTNFFEVIPPDTSGGVRRADIIFIMDNSGSMEDEQLAVENNVIDFVDNLSAAGIDFALGLCRYGQGANNGIPIIEDNGILTSDASYFKYDVWNRNVIDGGDEPGYYAIVQSSNSFIFRPGTQKVFIIITDETPDQGYANQQDALTACLNNSVTLFSLTTTDIVNDFINITQATNGYCFDIYSNFDEILDAISSQVANSYLVKYYSSDPVYNGEIRFVQVTANYLGFQDTDEGSYIPGDIPYITRTETTLAYHNQAWADGTSFNIEVEITDMVEPFVSETMVYYKNTNQSNYQSILIMNTSGNFWSGTIPGSAVNTPGIDYYITASDGQSTASDPSVDPINSPYQIAILPNVAPVITHIPVFNINVAEPVIVIADIVDNTNVLDNAAVFYRKYGQLSFQSVEMTVQSGNTYSASIPYQFVTDDGVEYYIWAVDNFGVGSYDGTPDNPHMAEATPDFADYLEEKLGIINNISQLERPFYGFSEPFYENIENQALNFVTNAQNAYNNGTADPLDLEGVGRLVLNERVAYRGLSDAIDIADYGAKGCKSLTFSFICKEGLKLVGNAVIHIPIIGEGLYNGIQGVNDKITNSIDKLNLAFNNGLIIPSGNLSPEQLSQAIGSTNQGLAEAHETLSEFVIEEGLGAVNIDVFETGENIIHDVLYLGTYEFQTSGNQQTAVNKAQSHNFPENTFNGAKAQATNTLFSMMAANQIAIDLGNFVNTINEVSGWIAIAAAFVLIIAGIVAALFTGGTSLLAAIAGIATLMLTYSAQLNQTTAIIEAGGAAIYVNGIMPYVYVNPSVDNAFGDGSKQNLPEKMQNIMQNSNYKITNNSEKLNDYYVQLKQRIVNGDSTWATTGMDSIAYYETLADLEDMSAIAKFMASAENASYFIWNFTDLTNIYLRQSAALDILSGSLIISATVYEAGYTDPSVISNAITSIDSLIANNSRMIQNRNDINVLLTAYGITSPTAIGIGNITAQKINSTHIKVDAEIVNYGSETALSINSELYVTNKNAVIANNNQIISLSGNESSNITFDVETGDSTLFGMIQVSPDPFNPNYYTMPPKSFSFSYQELTYSIMDNASRNNTIRFYPNPFNPGQGNLKIIYALKQDSPAIGRIYDMRGQQVKTLFENKFHKAGIENETEWDGTNNNGKFVGNGLYVYVIESDKGEKFTGKVTVLK
jgi:hypothetical protein